MKQWSQSPVSAHKKTAKKIGIITVTILLALTTPFQLMKVVQADDFDSRIAKIQAEIDQYQAQAGELNSRADSLQKEVDSLTAQKNVIQGQIDLKQAEHDKLVNQIAENEKKIADNKDVLGETIADLYVDSDVTPLEMLASSHSIADYVDKEAYRNTIRDNLITTISTIKDLKKKLEEQKKDVDRVIAEQRMAHDELASKEAQQANLVAQTRGEQAAYLHLVSDRQNQKLSVQKEQQAAIEAAMRRNGGGSINILPGDPNKGGYPWEAGCWLDANAWSYGGAYGDGTDPLGYGCRQCVSYAAWKVGQRTGNFPRYWGNANMWPASARASGYSTGSTPRVNSAGVISAGQYGHIVWVEAVNGDGTVDISQYNYLNAGGPGWGNYSKMRVSASTYDTYIYF